jgi:uncharacterized protein (TIGR00251 family)
MLWMQETPEGTEFKVVVQPRGANNDIVGLQGDALKIKLTAPPVEGAANKVCIQFLAKTLKVPKSDVIILSGKRSRVKKILVRSLPKERIDALLKTKV